MVDKKSKFWKNVRDAEKRVASWPKWKQDLLGKLISIEVCEECAAANISHIDDLCPGCKKWFLRIKGEEPPIARCSEHELYEKNGCHYTRRCEEEVHFEGLCKRHWEKQRESFLESELVRIHSILQNLLLSEGERVLKKSSHRKNVDYTTLKKTQVALMDELLKLREERDARNKWGKG